MDRFIYNFEKWVWQHMPPKIRNLGLQSVIALFTAAILKPFELIILKLANQLYDQIYRETASIETLRRRGLQYDLVQRPEENRDDFYKRVVIWEIMMLAGGVKQSIKSSIAILAGVAEPTITIDEGIKSRSGLFSIGITPIGSGGICCSSVIFSFTVWLPDLADSNINRAYILRSLDEFSPSNKFTIIEKRSTGDYTWEAA